MSETRHYDDLPTWEELRYLTRWKDAACPAAHRDIDARKSVFILHRLLEGLPHHLPIYAYGSPEWKAELAWQRKLDGLAVELERNMFMPKEKP